jgi:hypothetical protein
MNSWDSVPNVTNPLNDLNRGKLKVARGVMDGYGIDRPSDEGSSLLPTGRLGPEVHEITPPPPHVGTHLAFHLILA